jgi:hypothetical protein
MIVDRRFRGAYCVHGSITQKTALNMVMDVDGVGGSDDECHLKFVFFCSYVSLM